MLRGDQPRRDARQRYGLEIVDEIVWEVVDSAVDDLCGPGSIEERVATGRRARDPSDADRSGGEVTFSTTIGWPSRRRMRSVTMRAIESIWPPAGTGTI